MLQGIDLKAGGRNKTVHRDAPKSQNPYLKLLVKVGGCGHARMWPSGSVPSGLLGAGHAQVRIDRLLVSGSSSHPGHRCSAEQHWWPASGKRVIAGVESSGTLETGWHRNVAEGACMHC